MLCMFYLFYMDKPFFLTGFYCCFNGEREVIGKNMIYPKR